MDKKPSFLWALLVGAVFTILEIVIFILFSGGMKSDASIVDYIIYFITGALIGVGLIYFLRRSKYRGVARVVWIGFAVSLPFALFGMIFGSMIGSIGVLMLSVSPALFITGVGYFLGRVFVKK